MGVKKISSCFFLAGFLILGDIHCIRFAAPLIGLLPVSAQTGGESPASPAMQLYQLGYEQFDKSQITEALATFDRALVMARQEGDRSLEAGILNDIGVAHRNLANYPQALQSLNQALTIRQTLKDKAGIGQSLMNIGAVYQVQADYPKALEFYQQASVFLQEAGEQYGQAAILSNMGGIYLSLGQPSKALTTFETALSLFQQTGARMNEGMALANIGAAYSDMGDYTKSLEFFQKSLVIATEVQDGLGIGQTLLNMGAVYEKLTDYPQALQSYQQGLQVMTAIGELEAVGQALNNIGSVYRQLGQYPQALEFYDRALELRQKLGNTARIAVTLNNQGVALLEDGQITAATTKLYAAIDAFESLRPGLKDTDKISIFDKYRFTYGVLQKALIAQNQVKTALEVAERGRARAFVELVAKRLSPEAAEAYANQKIAPITIAEIQQVAAAQNATIVEYSIVVDNLAKNADLFIWVVQPTGEIAFRQVDLSSLNRERDNLVPFLVSEETEAQPETLLTALVRGTRADIATNLPSIPAGKVSNLNLKKLHELLIEPITDLLPSNPESKVIFIPHEELFFVPFAALVDGSDRYLIEKHTIITAPAIQVLQLARKSRDNRPVDTTNALVVGNPVMPKYSRVPGEPPETLPKLPGAEQEAIGIASMLNTQPLIGSTATETAVVQRIGKARIVHLATHGLLDDFSDSGMIGAIALTPSDSNDGLLTAEEIMALNLNASLVVLSACNTAGGKISGDGIIGLSRSLIGAGAESVIVSLWQVPDDATAKLMQEFYQVLPQTGDRAVALRKAILATMQQYPNVQDWGAFTLIGESEH
ncbi:MAG TPA: CHAT domain-containing protein [Oscillatoriaceae cyanobacterium M33_DOE_052]|uniref:CHAT domain-containing protein n=1 Tax=Planktothricoides sp. SpSt-374 TaxID=2282167 RepID=A0A7C3ZLA6_9CYAN|nr:CHAT domain-containing protein [Oscillatoriaceae cyanobacterium M33_DOE_052]